MQTFSVYLLLNKSNKKLFYLANLIKFDHKCTHGNVTLVDPLRDFFIV